MLKEFKLYGEMHRFLPAYVKWAGGKIMEMEVLHHPRMSGRPKYTLKKSINVLLDLITVQFLLSYHTKPIYFIGKYGVLCFLIGLFCFFFMFIKKLIWKLPIFTDPLFLSGIFFILIGSQIIFFGLTAELLMRLYFESRNKTPYMIKELINIELKTDSELTNTDKR